MVKKIFTSDDIPYTDKTGWDDNLEAYNLSPIRSLYPILKDGVYHRCSLRNCLSILSHKEIRPNTGQYEFTYPQSEYNFGYKNGWVCLFDFKKDPFHIYIAHDTWSIFFQQYEPITITLELNRSQLAEIIPNEYYDTEGHKGMTRIPYVEAWYPIPIPISKIENIIVVFTNRDPVDFSIISAKELRNPVNDKMEFKFGLDFTNNEYVMNFCSIMSELKAKYL